jgi:hypothetical protein
MSRPTAASRWPGLTSQRLFVPATALPETTRQYPERPVDHGNIMYRVFPMGEQTILREQIVTRNPLSLSNSHARTNNKKISPAWIPLLYVNKTPSLTVPLHIVVSAFWTNSTLKIPLFEAHNILKIADSFTHLPYRKTSGPSSYLLYRKYPFFHISTLYKIFPCLSTHTVHVQYIPLFRRPFPTQSLTLLGHVPYVRKVPCMIRPIPCSISET